MIKTGSIHTLSSISLAVLLAGCSGIGNFAGSDSLSLRSNPSDAEVYVMGQAVGRTPIEISQPTLYPSVYPQEQQHLYGVVTLKKTGCADFQRRVSGRDIARGLQVELDCGVDLSGNPPARAATVDTPRAAPEISDSTDPNPPMDDAAQSAKQRLQRINELKEEGLIDNQEYRAIRQRILDSL
jgi:hypothetical protein